MIGVTGMMDGLTAYAVHPSQSLEEFIKDARIGGKPLMAQGTEEVKDEVSSAPFEDRSEGSQGPKSWNAPSSSSKDADLKRLTTEYEGLKSEVMALIKSHNDMHVYLIDQYAALRYKRQKMDQLCKELESFGVSPGPMVDSVLLIVDQLPDSAQFQVLYVRLYKELRKETIGGSVFKGRPDRESLKTGIIYLQSVDQLRVKTSFAEMAARRMKVKYIKEDVEFIISQLKNSSRKCGLKLKLQIQGKPHKCEQGLG